MTCQPSGYVREKALKLLAQRTDGVEIPYLAIRTEDWVEPVRELARGSFFDRIVDANVDLLARHLVLFKDLSKRGRGLHREFAFEYMPDSQSPDFKAEGFAWAAAKSLFSKPGCIPALELLLRDPRSSIRLRTCCLEVSGGEARLLRLALKDQDPQLQMAAMVMAVGRANDFLDELHGLLKSKGSGVRRAALMWWFEKGAELARLQLEPFLLDSSAGVREAAVYYAKKAGAPNVQEVYRGALKSQQIRVRVIAIGGLADLGAWGDLPDFVSLVGENEAGIVAAALRASALKNDPQTEGLLRGYLSDPRPGVAGAAADGIFRLGMKVGLEELNPLAGPSASSWQRRLARRLTVRSGAWDRLAFYLSAIQSDDKVHAESCRRRFLALVVNPSAFGASPSNEQRTALRRSFAAVDGVFDQKTHRQFEFILA
jgi:HEAT repeat protein